MFKCVRNNLGKFLMAVLLSFALVGCEVNLALDGGGYDDEIYGGVQQIVDGVMSIIDSFD